MTDERSEAAPRRFSPPERDVDETDALWEQALAPNDRTEQRSHDRLETTLRELADVVSDAAMLTMEGKAQFRSDRRLQLAGEAVISHLGEVAGRLPRAFKDQHTGVPWHEIIGMRNRVIHEYQSINLDVLWNALSDEIPALGHHLDLTDRPDKPSSERPDPDGSHTPRRGRAS